MSIQAATNLVIFGAKGDLAHRLLLPSLFGLERDGLIGLLSDGDKLIIDAESGARFLFVQA